MVWLAALVIVILDQPALLTRIRIIDIMALPGVVRIEFKKPCVCVPEKGYASFCVRLYISFGGVRVEACVKKARADVVFLKQPIALRKGGAASCI